jgi:hypothetical protein
MLGRAETLEGSHYLVSAERNITDAFAFRQWPEQRGTSCQWIIQQSNLSRRILNLYVLIAA